MIGLTGVVLAPAKPALAGDQLTIVSTGGALQKAQRKALFEPFSNTTGVKITEDEYDGGSAKIRAMVDTRTVSWDVVDSGDGPAIQMCNEGVLEPIDWKKLGLDRSKFTDADKMDCGVPAQSAAAVVAYDKDKLPNGPQTIADLFDLKKFPGKRGLYKSPGYNLEWALIADGVPVKDVYKVLGTPEGVDRAFKKLDTIKKDVIWWTSGAQAPQLLADGQVVMTAAWNGRIYDANRNAGKHFQILWDAQQPLQDYWVIPKGTRHLEEAYKFIAFATSGQAQADLTRYIPYAPGNKEAMALVDPASLPDLPTAPQNIANVMPSGATFWAEKDYDLRQRFTSWLTE
ncbi:ABC transporter substrate-binding protein [Bradyrhizobium sp. WSM 1791]|uniref:ABC transporter substrate-binding protein n=1 Tax=Bradyrhizobium australiense TaxID=2721161 RepID=A0A7Y4GZF9_9BRAD|nr:ABC transporter substrate-binding protein [Bradyrhizobium australiense]